MIRGFITGRSAYVTGRLILPRLRRAERADFLLDTGAQFSLIHPRDIKSLGLDVMTAFAGHGTTEALGIGGSAASFQDEAIVSFSHEDGAIVGYRFDPMLFAVPTDYNADYPSILSMDFISAFELVINAADRLVELR